MTPAALTRASGLRRPAAPVRLLHLGLGNFFRAHQAWYTDHSPDAEGWGYAAFSGRGAAITDALNAQDGLYTVITRALSGDHFELVASLSRAHAADEHDAWLDYFRSPDIAAVTVTVTEAGWLPDATGRLDTARPELQADLAVLRQDHGGPVRTAPARLVAGLAARRRADAGPVALVPCDNVARNGALAQQAVHDLADLADPALADWIADSVAVVATMVDRITPRTTPDDVAAVAAATGFDDRCPVVTEPFHEWVLSGSFPNGRPHWEAAGATFTGDVTPFEHRKLWLLNGAHSLLAYAGSIRGHTTVPEAAADDTCREWVQEWWTEASRHLEQPAAEIAAYRGVLLDRFANTGMGDRLDRIAADGSHKLPIRVIPVLRAERAAGRLPHGATRILAAWVCHLRGYGAPVADARADEVVGLAQGPLLQAVGRLLDRLDAGLGDDSQVAATVVEQAEQLTTQYNRGHRLRPLRS